MPFRWSTTLQTPDAVKATVKPELAVAATLKLVLYLSLIHI